MESTGNGLSNVFRTTVRHRFSIFNVSSTYSFQRNFDDVAPGGPSLPTNNYDPDGDWSRSPVPRPEATGDLQMP